MSHFEILAWTFAPSPGAYGKVAVFEEGRLVAEVSPKVADALKALQARIAVLEDRLDGLIQTREKAAKEIAKEVAKSRQGGRK